MDDNDTMNNDVMDEEYKNDIEQIEFRNKSLTFIDIEYDDDDDDDDDNKVNDFQSHPEYSIAFSCDNIGKLKLWQMKKNDVKLLKYANMRYDVENQDDIATCCTIDNCGKWVAFGGGYNNNSKGLIICYQINLKSQNYYDIELKFVIDGDHFQNDNDDYYDNGDYDDDYYQQNYNLGAIYSIQFDETGQLLFVGNHFGEISVFNVEENGEFIQSISYKANNDRITDLCFYSNYIFVLTPSLCFAYFCDYQENKRNPINLSTLEIIRDSNSSILPFKNIDVAQYDNNHLIVYITSNKLEWNILPFDNEIYKIKNNKNNNNKIGYIDINDNNNNNEKINSLNIDHKNEYIVISTNKYIKSYQIGINDDNPLKVMVNSARSNITKCAINYKYEKYVAICYEKPCKIELKKFINKK